MTRPLSRANHERLDGPLAIPLASGALDALERGAYLRASRPSRRAIAEGAMSLTAKVTDASFEADVIKSAEPVIVDFWAEWCGPCRMIAPALEEIATEMKGKVKIAKLNVDENPGVASKYGIRSIPTLMVFKDGKQVATKTGAGPKSELSRWIDASV